MRDVYSNVYKRWMIETGLGFVNRHRKPFDTVDKRLLLNNLHNVESSK